MISLWKTDLNDSFITKNKELRDTDVAIIGGGITGIMTAYQLNKRGIDCTVIERGNLFSGQTQNTTAKITAQHGLKYKYLYDTFGFCGAKQYAEANRDAIRLFEEIISEENIDCDFIKLPSVLYTKADNSKLEEEFKTALALGIDAQIVKTNELPFEISSALSFDNQAMFHPLKFLGALTKNLDIHENTAVKSINGNEIITNKGTLKCKKVIIATNFPIKDFPGFYFAKMHRERSYVVALENCPQYSAMYYGIDSDGISLRNAGKYLLVSGCSHRSGECKNNYEVLLGKAKKLYPDSKEAFRWSAEDCMPLDKVPYIGKFSSFSDNIFVATGFQKWGMTTSMVSSIIISDLIENKAHPYPIFSPDRKNLKASSKQFVKEAVESSKNLAREFILPAKDKNLSSLKPNQAGTFDVKGKKLGVYRDESGAFHAVINRCTHLGCLLEWNDNEKTWDCPCHGSRFDFDGKLLDCPACENLKIQHLKD